VKQEDVQKPLLIGHIQQLKYTHTCGFLCC